MDKRTKKKFKRQNITEMAKYDKSFEDNVRGYVDNGIKAIDDLIIYGCKLPNEEQKRFFSYENVSRLVRQILRGNSDGIHYYSKKKNKTILKGQSVGEKDKHYDVEFNTRMVQIAALLVKEATEVCIAYYRENHKHEPELNKYVVERIMEAAMICQIIAKQRRSMALSESIKISDDIRMEVTRASQKKSV